METSIRALHVHESDITKMETGSSRYIWYFIRRNMNVDILHSGEEIKIGNSIFFSTNLKFPDIRGLNEALAPLKLYYFRRSLKEKLKLLEDRYDIIHTHTTLVLDYVPAAKKPIVLTSHGTSDSEFKYATILGRLRFQYEARKCERKIMGENINKIAKIIAVSKFVRDEIKELYEVPKEKLTVIYNGIDTEFYKPTTEDPKDDYFLYVGRLDKRKGFYELIEAIKELDDYKFVIISSSFKQRRLNRYAKILLSLSKRQENIVIPRNVSDEEIKWYYSNAKATILPSRYDPFPYTVLESMACGTPCIVSDNGGAKEAIGKYGKVFRAGSSEDLKRSIENFSYPQNWRKKVRICVEEKFNLNSFIRNIISTYHEVVEEWST